MGYHAKLTRLLATNFRRDKEIIVGGSSKISSELISIATGIPNNGEKWFKNLDLDVQNYRSFIKGHYKDAIKKFFHFGQLLDNFGRFMNDIMRYFTCEAKFSRL